MICKKLTLCIATWTWLSHFFFFFHFHKKRSKHMGHLMNFKLIFCSTIYRSIKCTSIIKIMLDNPIMQVSNWNKCTYKWIVAVKLAMTMSHIVGFQFLDLYSSNPIQSGSITISFVEIRFYCCVLFISYWKFGRRCPWLFCKRDKQ